MVRFMVVTFAFLAWAFYTMSGGADFEPDRARLDRNMADPLQPADVSEPESAQAAAEGIEVTRVSLDLTSVEDVLSGRDDRRTNSALPQQTGPAVQPGPQTDRAAIIPSLVQNATPEGAVPGAEIASADVTTESVSLDTSTDVRVVSGSRVNVRGGPGTSHGIVDTLVRGDEVEVLDDSGAGWVRIRATDGGTMGWIAASLLTSG